MSDINSCVIVGRLTQDIGTDERSFGYTKGGTARANVSVAVNRSVKNGDQYADEASFISVQIWGKTAENLKPYLRKGQQVCVEGYIKQDRWKDGSGGNREKTFVVANSVQLIGKKGDAPQETVREQQSRQEFSPADGFPEDIPF